MPYSIASTASGPSIWRRSSTRPGPPANRRASGCRIRRGRTPRPRSTRWASCIPTTFSICGCRCLMSSARCCSPCDPDRVPDRRGRPRRQDRREPRGGSADVHGCRAADLREGPRPHQRNDGGRGRRQEEDLRLGDRCRAAGVEGPPGRTIAVAVGFGAVQARRQARLLDHPGTLRRPVALLRLRLGPARPRRRAVVRRGRHQGSRGLRPVGDVRRVVPQPPGRIPVRNRRLAVPRHRGGDRRGRRDPHQGPA